MSDRGDFYAPDDVKRWRTLALGIGGIGLIIWAVGVYFNSEQALRSWILGYIFWSGIGIGCLGVLLMGYLTGGAWAVVTRRTLEAGARTLPIIILLFIPLALGVASGKVYTWTHMSPTEHVMEQRGWFMTPSSWILRSALYFAIFGTMTYLLSKWSALQDKTTNPEDSAVYLGKATAL